MVRTKQGGSVLVFIIGGVLLAALLGGGIYWISRQNESHTASMPTPPAPQQAPAPSLTQPRQPPRQQQEKEQPSSDPTPTQLPSNGSEPSAELPSTGPSGSIASALVLASLSGLVVSYLRSRRKTASF